MPSSVSSYQFQAVQGPADGDRTHTLTEGYQPVSRIGETVINCFVDAYEFAALAPSINHKQLTNEPDGNYGADMNGPGGAGGPGTTVAEYKPMFHEWSTALPGMICLARKARNATFRNYVAAETATPVITSCACLPREHEQQFYFAGICRSKSVRPIDDGVGPSVDEFFTMAIGGMATILNNSKSAIFPGDYVCHTRATPAPHPCHTHATPAQIEWTFYSEIGANQATAQGRSSLERNKKGPRRVGVRVASSTSSRVIGRSLTFAKSNASRRPHSNCAMPCTHLTTVFAPSNRKHSTF